MTEIEEIQAKLDKAISSGNNVFITLYSYQLEVEKRITALKANNVGNPEENLKKSLKKISDNNPLFRGVG